MVTWTLACWDSSAQASAAGTPQAWGHFVRTLIGFIKPLWLNMMCNWGEHIFIGPQIFGDLWGRVLIHQRGHQSLDGQMGSSITFEKCLHCTFNYSKKTQNAYKIIQRMFGLRCFLWILILFAMCQTWQVCQDFATIQHTLQWGALISTGSCMSGCSNPKTQRETKLASNISSIAYQLPELLRQWSAHHPAQPQVVPPPTEIQLMSKRELIIYWHQNALPDLETQ